MTLIDALLAILLILVILYLIVTVLRATPGPLFTVDRVVLFVVLVLIVLWLLRGHIGLR